MSFFMTPHQHGIKKSQILLTPKGFTLIEMMITILVMAILSSVAGFYILDHRRNVSLKEAVYKISGNLHTTKANAIGDKTSYSINFNTPVVDQYTLTSNNEIVDLSALFGAVTFTANPDASADAFTNTITFNSRGICTASGQIYMTNQDGHIYRIQTSGAGGISIQMWNGVNWF